MTRVAAASGILLGLVLLIGGWTSGQLAAGMIATVVAGLLGWSGWGALRHRQWARGLLCFLGLGVLVVALPGYFRTYRVWPLLPVILFATLTLGFGILSWTLDRFQAPEKAEPRL
jgi:hypothetical protein